MASIPAKSALVSTRATPARKATYVDVASREGMRLSEWLRVQAERRVAELCGSGSAPTFGGAAGVALEQFVGRGAGAAV